MSEWRIENRDGRERGVKKGGETKRTTEGKFVVATKKNNNNKIHKISVTCERN
jgi:hypothetical protein